VLLILEAITVEVGLTNPRRTLAVHRRLASTFRDHCLLDIFTVAVDSLEWVKQNYNSTDLSEHQSTVSNSRSSTTGGGGGGGGDGFTAVPPVANSRGLQTTDVILASLKLAHAALSFDFVCMFPDDGEDSPTVSIPSSWRPVLCKDGLFDLFWMLYESLPLQRHHDLALQCLIQLCSCRRSLFQTDEERKGWLVRILRGTMAVAERHTWLGEPETL
jgi:exportin-7